MSDYLDAVAAPLKGPRRLREDMLAEIGDGFEDAVAERIGAGQSPREAARDAAAEFGEPRLVAAEVQRELVAAQAKRTAWTLVTALPAMTIMWDLFSGDGEVSLAITLLARLTDTATAAAFVTGALVLTGHLHRRAAGLCGVLGITQVTVALACSAVISAIGEGGGPVAPWAALLGASAVGSVVVVASSARALAVARTRIA
ncbi:hypothetical protein SAMN05216298_4225 [Glycomyces sambucus]|uniref:Uncharacterized protein n=1 Tax=Glycomyces sambucus TaxID=380244 RepID=A0A1G9KSA8_9ACTN|nr:permease prefix domain 1-containing protein [Glycomyces sambucus]SDL52552.1 hypothetical protein SAMN05216298_4225 [Glycomyces sambucus]